MNKIKNNGFTLVDVLIGTGLLVIVIAGLYGLFQFSLRVISQSRARITASALVNQKIETAKNLAYADIGTVGGIPNGQIPETEVISRNGIEYTVKTTVTYIDDPFDGTAPTDTVPNDYKKIRVKVSWPGFLGGELVAISDIAPKGLETTEGGGNLLVSVFDALGAPIEQANIHIVNNQTDPLIDTNYQTNNQGQYLVAGAPSSTNAFQITVSKPNHSQSRTYGSEEVANPIKPHTTVLEGMLTETSFSIDELSEFSITTLSLWGITIPDISFNLRGNKIIGTDAQENPVYKYSQNHSTNASGQVNVSDLEWDLYSFTIDPIENLDLVSTTPTSTPAGREINLLPGTTNQEIVLYLKAENSLMITVKDSETAEPIFNTQIRAYNTGLSYDKTLFTNEDGQTIFIPLEAAAYNLEVSADGYDSYIGNISISGDQTVVINLTRNEPS